MPAIPHVGKCFDTAKEFLAYLDGLQFGVWRPRYVVMHHTGGPDLKTWRAWQTRAKPVSDEQWMENLASYYGSPPPVGPADGPWQHAPQFFFTPAHFCVLSIPTVRGTHAKSFNANSWGVECVGDFDSEPFEGAIKDHYIEGLAALHVAAGLQVMPYERGVRGLHLHRDDPLTNKTCAGLKVNKDDVARLVQAKIYDLTGGEHESEKIVVAPTRPVRTGTVSTSAADPKLNVRAAAAGNAPVLLTLTRGDKVSVTGEATNGETKWYSVDIPGDADGWVAARFVTL